MSIKQAWKSFWKEQHRKQCTRSPEAIRDAKIRIEWEESQKVQYEVLVLKNNTPKNNQIHILHRTVCYGKDSAVLRAKQVQMTYPRNQIMICKAVELGECS